MSYAPMFKKTTNSTNFRTQIKAMLEVIREPGDRLQLLQRDQPVRVILTQDEFLELFTKARAYDNLNPEHPIRGELIEVSKASRANAKAEARRELKVAEELLAEDKF